jgi:hypothetical protein
MCFCPLEARIRTDVWLSCDPLPSRALFTASSLVPFPPELQGRWQFGRTEFPVGLFVSHGFYILYALLRQLHARMSCCNRVNPITKTVLQSSPVQPVLVKSVPLLNRSNVERTDRAGPSCPI